MKKILQICLILPILMACSATKTTRGNYLFAEDVQMIQPTITTQSEVLNILGTPTAKAVFNENIWYYVGLKTEKESFFDEKIVERQVYKLTFDDIGIVQAIVEEQSDAVDVPLASRVTPTSGNEVTFMQQILGNIGKFNPPSK